MDSFPKVLSPEVECFLIVSSAAVTFRAMVSFPVVISFVVEVSLIVLSVVLTFGGEIEETTGESQNDKSSW